MFNFWSSYELSKKEEMLQHQIKSLRSLSRMTYDRKNQKDLMPELKAKYRPLFEGLRSVDKNYQTMIQRSKEQSYSFWEMLQCLWHWVIGNEPQYQRLRKKFENYQEKFDHYQQSVSVCEDSSKKLIDMLHQYQQELLSSGWHGRIENDQLHWTLPQMVQELEFLSLLVPENTYSYFKGIEYLKQAQPANYEIPYQPMQNTEKFHQHIRNLNQFLMEDRKSFSLENYNYLMSKILFLNSYPNRTDEVKTLFKNISNQVYISLYQHNPSVMERTAAIHVLSLIEPHKAEEWRQAMRFEGIRHLMGIVPLTSESVWDEAEWLSQSALDHTYNEKLSFESDYLNKESLIPLQHLFLFSKVNREIKYNLVNDSSKLKKKDIEYFKEQALEKLNQPESFDLGSFFRDVFMIKYLGGLDEYQFLKKKFLSRFDKIQEVKKSDFEKDLKKYNSDYGFELYQIQAQMLLQSKQTMVNEDWIQALDQQYQNQSNNLNKRLNYLMMLITLKYPVRGELIASVSDGRDARYLDDLILAAKEGHFHARMYLAESLMVYYQGFYHDRVTPSESEANQKDEYERILEHFPLEKIKAWLHDGYLLKRPAAMDVIQRTQVITINILEQLLLGKNPNNGLLKKFFPEQAVLLLKNPKYLEGAIARLSAESKDKLIQLLKITPKGQEVSAELWSLMQFSLNHRMITPESEPEKMPVSVLKPIENTQNAIQHTKAEFVRVPKSAPAPLSRSTSARIDWHFWKSSRRAPEMQLEGTEMSTLDNENIIPVKSF